MGVIEPLELLFEHEGLPSFELPEQLARAYGGPLGFDAPRLYANFVATVDGTVALPGIPQSVKLVSGARESDRFVMALLRACADVVLVGSGTMRAAPGATWGPERVYPAGEEAFAELRGRLGKTPAPGVAIMSASGMIDPEHAAIRAGALVLTSEEGAARLGARVPADQLVALGGESTVDPEAAVGELRRRGSSLILSEAGPAVFGSLVGAGLVDELFLTMSPYLAGGQRPGSRLGLGEGIALLPEQRVEARLLSLRRDSDFLFVRYALSAPSHAD
jgi:riboflavin biosynthesis pyrimidine reductase